MLLKIIMTNKTLTIKFANGATNGATTSMFIKGNTIYSYGYHFIIAQIINNKKAIFNIRKYSQTTGRHQSLVLRTLETFGFQVEKKEL